jgi:hypothetical protein
VIGLGLHDIAGNHPDANAADCEPVDCPWCEGYHLADDDLCAAMPIAPSLDEISEQDIDEVNPLVWLGGAA